MVKADTQARAAAEAAAWLARLQQDGRSPQTEAAFQDWLRTDAANASAFARATDIWEMLPGAAAVRDLTGVTPLPVRRRSSGYVEMALAATVLAGLVAGGVYWTSRPAVFETAAGEQQVKTLRDGSRVSLNTDSRISVSYGGGVRHIALERGEAVFDVEHDPAHPFLVDAGGERVRALGTSFAVRRETGRVTVTLIRGRVDVSRIGDAGGPAVIQAELTPGERATVVSGAAAVVDRPSIDAVTAWRHGEVVFSNTTLAAAADEINRYGPVKVVVNDASVAELPVSGVFETNDPTEFAVVMAKLNGLHARRIGGRIELSR